MSSQLNTDTQHNSMPTKKKKQTNKQTNKQTKARHLFVNWNMALGSAWSRTSSRRYSMATFGLG